VKKVGVKETYWDVARNDEDVMKGELYECKGND